MAKRLERVKSTALLRWSGRTIAVSGSSYLSADLAKCLDDRKMQHVHVRTLSDDAGQWAKFFTAAPRRQRRSVERYNIDKRV
jgi:hypothetical protein